MASKLYRIMALSLFITVYPLYIFGQVFPSDLLIRASAGGVEPWEDIVSIQIDTTGYTLYTRYLPGSIGDPPLEQNSFTLSTPALERIWQAIETYDFFNLDSSYISTRTGARTFAFLSIRANGQHHEVTTEDSAAFEFDKIMRAINSETPGELDLLYDTSEPPNIWVADPCSGLPAASIFKAGLDRYGMNKETPSPSPESFSSGEVVFGNLAHPATVVHTNMPLREAVQKGIATLRAKGRFFGDGVSITVDNSGTPVPSEEVNITMYLEFYGSSATPENVSRIEKAIEDRWSVIDVDMGDGRKVDLKTTVIPRVKNGAAIPPGTPGYHQIKLIENTRSNVGGLGFAFNVNEGFGWGTWRTTGSDLDGMYAHEAGHLLGMPDRYVNYTKTGVTDNFAWRRTTDLVHISNEEMAQIYADAESGVSYEQALNVVENKSWLDQMSFATAPEYEHDMMASNTGIVSNEDLRNLINQAGLLVYVEPGDIFMGKDPDEQNFVTTRPENVFAPSGEIKRLDGIYIACIDAEKAVPSPGASLDLGLNLANWQGIPAAEMLLTFLQTASARDEYCFDGVSIGTWRLTDNVAIDNASLREFMADHGVILEDEFLEFPHLSNPNQNDSTTSLVLPRELFVTEIFPQATLTQTGLPVELNWILTPPTGIEVDTTSFSWSLQKPEGSSAGITDPQSLTAKFTPDQRGFYHPTLNLSITPVDWPGTNIKSSARVVVADSLTDTFERDSLVSEQFPWETSNDAPWTLSDMTAFSGGFSARSGAIDGFETTSLEIRAFFPVPGEIFFAYRLHSGKNFDFLRFYIDGIEQAAWTGIVDWADTSFVLGAGDHRFAWKYIKLIGGSFGADAAWIDDVFFPTSSIPTSVVADNPVPALPATHSLSQNYPNPFNPVTTIFFALPVAQEITLIVYDQLGRNVATLIDGRRQAGNHQVVFDASDLPSGIYYYRLTGGSFTETRAMVVFK